jgi:hypothetical protein
MYTSDHRVAILTSEVWHGPVTSADFGPTTMLISVRTPNAGV